VGFFFWPPDGISLKYLEKLFEDGLKEVGEESFSGAENFDLFNLESEYRMVPWEFLKVQLRIRYKQEADVFGRNPCYRILGPNAEDCIEKYHLENGADPKEITGMVIQKDFRNYGSALFDVSDGSMQNFPEKLEKNLDFVEILISRGIGPESQQTLKRYHFSQPSM